MGNSYEEHFLFAVDANYADILDAAGIYDSSSYRDLIAANDARGANDPIPVLASAEFISLDFNETRSVFVGRVYVPVEIIGEATVTPDGWASGPYVIIPLDGLLTSEFERDVPLTIAFLDGPNAEQAALDAEIPATAISSRSAWLSGVRDSALIGGVEWMMILAVLAVAVLAAVALLVTVLGGVRERGIALSMLRTQGLSNRFGWWLALSELGPLTVAALIGGATAGLSILVLLGRTLGLEILSGGISAPPLVADQVFLGAVGAGVLRRAIFILRHLFATGQTQQPQRGPGGDDEGDGQGKEHCRTGADWDRTHVGPH